jgi:hypothetical protein
MRKILPPIVAILVLAGWVHAGTTWWGNQHGYGWPWEHTLQEWSDITQKTHQPHPLLTYGPCNFHDDKRFWESYCWVTIQVPG